jgi:Rhabdovirus nucleocapsid protein
MSITLVYSSRRRNKPVVTIEVFDVDVVELRKIVFGSIANSNLAFDVAMAYLYRVLSEVTSLEHPDWNSFGKQIFEKKATCHALSALEISTIQTKKISGTSTNCGRVG